MGKASNPITFSRHFGVDEKELDRLDVFNITLSMDTKLFIDPMMLKSSQHVELSQTATAQYKDHFGKVIKLIAASKTAGDASWKGAVNLLKFPEVSGTCLGYGSGSIHGSGFGKALSSRIIRVASEIIEVGIVDVDLFAAMALFEPDIGPDRISDMTTNIIFGALADFNRRIIKELGMKGKDYTYKGITSSFVMNPFENDIPIILVPKDILKDLPIAKDWDGIADAAAKNAKLRDEVNKNIAHIWAVKTKRSKSTLKKAALKDKATFETLLKAMKEVPTTPYDVGSDPDGVVRWAAKGQEYADKFPLNFGTKSAKSLNDVYLVVKEIIVQFRQLIEHEGLNKELYRSNGKPRFEATAQRLFFSVAYSYCKANNIDISPEIDTGNGKIDFKFSTGFNQRVLVEIKLSTNSNVVTGYTTQLEIYKAAQQTMRAIYLLMDVGSMGKKDQKIIDAKNEAAKRKEPLSDIEIIDGILKPSASTRKLI